MEAQHLADAVLHRALWGADVTALFRIAAERQKALRVPHPAVITRINSHSPIASAILNRQQFYCELLEAVGSGRTRLATQARSFRFEPVIEGRHSKA